jgi:hypothetical protein
MSALPQGTVTFAFTDIEGSTELLKQLGERYRDVLAQHRRIVRERFTEAGGVEMDTQGDAFFFAFTRTSDAVAAAVDVQRAHAAAEWPDRASVRVRNRGPDGHELLMIRLGPQGLPFRGDGLTVDEDAVERNEVGVLEPADAGAVRNLEVHLAPGRYILLCNMSGHYLGGMRRVVVVR